jgi:hypothetical protein
MKSKTLRPRKSDRLFNPNRSSVWLLAAYAPVGLDDDDGVGQHFNDRAIEGFAHFGGFERSPLFYEVAAGGQVQGPSGFSAFASLRASRLKGTAEASEPAVSAGSGCSDTAGLREGGKPLFGFHRFQNHDSHPGSFRFSGLRHELEEFFLFLIGERDIHLVAFGPVNVFTFHVL